MSDRQFLLLLRVMLVTFTLAALLFALNSKSTMYEMVQNAYKVTLVSCIVPLAAGIFWKRANIPGAVLSVVFGLVSWTIAEWATTPETVIPAARGLGVLARRHGARLASSQREPLPAHHHVKH